MLTHIMKTTLEIEDQLLIQAKTVAAQRRTTLRAIVEHALRREVQTEVPDQGSFIAYSKEGIPYYKGKDDGRVVTSEQIYQLMEEEGI